VDGAGGVLDEEQNVDPFEEHRAGVEQIAAEDPVGLCLQETTALTGAAPDRGMLA
jgi:hypothetical protein